MVPIKWKHKAVETLFGQVPSLKASCVLLVKKLQKKLRTLNIFQKVIFGDDSPGLWSLCLMPNIVIKQTAWEVLACPGKHSMGRVDKFTNTSTPAWKSIRPTPRLLISWPKKTAAIFSILETTRFVYNNFIPVVSVLCKYPSWQNDAAAHGNSWRLCRCSPDTLSEPAEIYYQIGPKKYQKMIQKADKSMDARFMFQQRTWQIFPKKDFQNMTQTCCIYTYIYNYIYNDIHHICKALNEFVF